MSPSPLLSFSIILPALPPLLNPQWRTRFRQQMNKAENQASTRALDSLINYEVRMGIDGMAGVEGHSVNG